MTSAGAAAYAPIPSRAFEVTWSAENGRRVKSAPSAERTGAGVGADPV